MKMMGGGRLPFPASPHGAVDMARERREEEEERERKEEDEEDDEVRYKENGGRKPTVQERTIDCKDFEGRHLNAYSLRSLKPSISISTIFR